MRLRKLLLLAALVAPSLLGAQQATGRIVGRVTTDAGRPLPSVSVNLSAVQLTRKLPAVTPAPPKSDGRKNT